MTQAKVETVSPASRLATPTDLTPAEVWPVIGMGNLLIADALALCRQTKKSLRHG